MSLSPLQRTFAIRLGINPQADLNGANPQADLNETNPQADLNGADPQADLNEAVILKRELL